MSVVIIWVENMKLPEMLVMSRNVLDEKYGTLSRFWLEVHEILVSSEPISLTFNIFFFLVLNIDTHELIFSSNVY